VPAGYARDLFIGCCAGKETPAFLGVKRIIRVAVIIRTQTVFHQRYQDPYRAVGGIWAISSKKSFVRV